MEASKLTPDLAPLSSTPSPKQLVVFSQIFAGVRSAIEDGFYDTNNQAGQISKTFREEEIQSLKENFPSIREEIFTKAHVKSSERPLQVGIDWRTLRGTRVVWLSTVKVNTDPLPWPHVPSTGRIQIFHLLHLGWDTGVEIATTWCKQLQDKSLVLIRKDLKNYLQMREEARTRPPASLVRSWILHDFPEVRQRFAILVCQMRFWLISRGGTLLSTKSWLGYQHVYTFASVGLL